MQLLKDFNVIQLMLFFLGKIWLYCIVRSLVLYNVVVLPDLLAILYTILMFLIKKKLKKMGFSINIEPHIQ